MNIKVKLLPTTRTDLQCVHCGNFLTRNFSTRDGSKRGRHWALVPPSDTSDENAYAGLHSECREGMSVKRRAST